MALTHDGTLLTVAVGNRLRFYDVQKLIAENPGALVGSLRNEGIPAQYFHVAITRDDRYLFVANHAAQSIGVVDLALARRTAFGRTSIVGSIPLGIGPAALVFSPDGHLLYATSQIAADDWNWPNMCRPITARSVDVPPNHPRGAVSVVDVMKATTDPAHAVLATVAAGCDPVRLVLSPAGDRAFVTARSDNAVLMYDTGKLLTDTTGAFLGALATTTGPVGLAAFDGGKRIAVATSTRFAASGAGNESLSIFDVSAALSGRNALAGMVPIQPGPLELAVSADGRTLLLTTYESRALEVIDIARMPLNGAPEPMARPSPAADRQEVVLDRAILEQYAGVYELRPDLMLTVTVDGNTLLTQGTGQPQVRAYASSERAFFLNEADIQIEFFKDSSGRVTHMVVRQQGREMPAKRVP